jgi:hypothetical protein
VPQASLLALDLLSEGDLPKAERLAIERAVGQLLGEAGVAEIVLEPLQTALDTTDGELRHPPALGAAIGRRTPGRGVISECLFADPARRGS